jgi:sugar phosphate isomerase/epimerase
MIVSLVTDEVSGDLETAFELGTAWGVRHFELRGIGAERVPRIGAYERDRLHHLLDRFGAQVVAISPGLFKIPLADAERPRFPLQVIDQDLHRAWRSSTDLVQQHLEELLPASLDFAAEVQAPVVVVFGFLRGGQPAGPAPTKVLESLRTAADQAQKAGLALVVEVEDGTWADTGRRTADLVQAVGQPGLGVNWDPGNNLIAGERPYPDGYNAVRGLVRHVHFKDVRLEADGTHKYVVQGQIDWPGQIQALAQDGFSGAISVETHMAPKVASAQAAVERLQRLIAG